MCVCFFLLSHTVLFFSPFLCCFFPVKTTWTCHHDLKCVQTEWINWSVHDLELATNSVLIFYLFFFILRVEYDHATFWLVVCLCPHWVSACLTAYIWLSSNTDKNTLICNVTKPEFWPVIAWPTVASEVWFPSPCKLNFLNVYLKKKRKKSKLGAQFFFSGT